MAFGSDLQALVAQLDPVRHAAEIERLRSCRDASELHRIVDDGGWLVADRTEPRLKLIRHGSGTWLVVQYEDGWSTRLAMQPFRR